MMLGGIHLSPINEHRLALPPQHTVVLPTLKVGVARSKKSHFQHS